MADLDIDLAGDESLQATLEELEQDFSGSVEWLVGNDADYGPILERGRGPVVPKDADALHFTLPSGEEIFAQEVSGHPPYPFFRPAIRELESGVNAFVRKNVGMDLDDSNSVAEVMRLLATSLETQVKRNVTAQAAGGRSPGTHPEHPRVVTGNLRSSTFARRLK